MARHNLTPLSADYAALSEMTYRRDPNITVDNNGQAVSQNRTITTIDTVDGVSAINPLDSPTLQTKAQAWRPGASVEDYIQDQYGLTIDPVDRGDGLTHFYSESGFSGYLSVRTNDPMDPSDDQVIIAFRGTDVADNGDGAMTDYLKQAGLPIVGGALAGRNSHKSWDEYRADIEAKTGQPFTEFSRGEIDPATGQPDSRFVDPGDIYTNLLLGKGTYQQTQYDDAKALVDLVQDNYTSNGEQVVVTGQSLGGGLAGLVAAEYGLEGHTFGMAPFQNQIEVIAQRNAVRDMLTSDRYAEQLGSVQEQYASLSPREQIDFERTMAQDINGLRTSSGGHSGRNDSIRIDRFNDEYGTSLSKETVREYRGLREGYDDQINADKSGITASTVQGEFTVSGGGQRSWLGWVVDAGAADLIDDRDMNVINLGRDLSGYEGGSAFMGESLVRHSPALNNVLVGSEDRGEGSLSEVFRSSDHFKYALFNQPGLAGGVSMGKVGALDDNSASRSEVPTGETLYRGLSNSMRGDSEFFDYSQAFFLDIGEAGRTSHGADARNPESQNLHKSVTEIGVQIARDEASELAPGDYPTGEAARFAGDYTETGYVDLDLNRIDAIPEQNYRGGDADGLNGVYGVDGIQKQIFEDVRDNLTTPSGTRFWQSGSEARARLAEGITGAERDYDYVTTARGTGTAKIYRGVDAGDEALQFSRVIAETGETQDLDINLKDGDSGAESGAKFNGGAAVFTGAGADSVTGSDRQDFVSLGAGNDIYTSDTISGDIVVGGAGADSYRVGNGTGPVYMSVQENVTEVTARVSSGTSAGQGGLVSDQLVSIEQVSGSASADIFNVESLSGNRYIDGAGGADHLYYGDLDRDVDLDITDGVDAHGRAYTARLSDGETTLYIINIDDDKISNTRGENTALQLDRAEIEAANEHAEVTRSVPLHEVGQILAADIPALRQNLAQADAAGTSNAADQDLLMTVSSPMPVALLHSLQDGGVDAIDLPDMEGMTPQQRVETILDVASQAYDPATMPSPELDDYYGAEERESEADQTQDVAAVVTPSPEAQIAARESEDMFPAL